MEPAWNLRDPRRWSILLTFEKLMYWSKLNQRGGRQPAALLSEPCSLEELGKLEVANAALLF
jgi:hypothetical protein